MWLLRRRVEDGGNIGDAEPPGECVPLGRHVPFPAEISSQPEVQPMLRENQCHSALTRLFYIAAATVALTALPSVIEGQAYWLGQHWEAPDRSPSWICPLCSEREGASTCGHHRRPVTAHLLRHA